MDRRLDVHLASVTSAVQVTGANPGDRVMAIDRLALFARLKALGIATTTVEHTPMFTVEQSEALRGQIQGANTCS